MSDRSGEMSMRKQVAIEILDELKRGGESSDAIKQMKRCLNMTSIATELVDAVVLCTVVNYSRISESGQAIKEVTFKIAPMIAEEVGCYHFNDMEEGNNIFRRIMFEARHLAEDYCGVDRTDGV